MKAVIITISSLLSFTCAVAQVKDTAAISLAGDSAAYAVYRWAQLSPAFIQQGMPAAFNRAHLAYQHTGGTFMAAQDASAANTIQAATEGKAVLGTVHLWGAFSYEKTTEDSTRFAHQTRNNSTAPYYYGSPVNVSYHRTVYKASAMVQKGVAHNRLPLGVGVDYRIGNHFSANDPRGSISDFELRLAATAGYTFAKKLTAGLQGYYGYGQEVFSIGYKNEMYQQSTVYPEYVNYVINGYGEPDYQFNYLRYRNNRKHGGAGFSLLYQLPQGLLALQGKRISETQRFEYRGSQAPTLLSLYHLHTSQINLLWNKKQAHHNFTAQLQWQLQEGKDFHQKYLANNYRYNAWGYTGALAYTVQAKGVTYNYGLRGQMNREQRIDGIYGNNLRYNRASLSPGFGMAIPGKGKITWGYDINAVYDKAMSHQATVSSMNVSYFTREVIDHDYFYQTADAAGGNLSLHVSKAFDGYNAGIKISGSYRRALQWDALEWPQARYPGKNRYSINAGVYFFF